MLRFFAIRAAKAVVAVSSSVRDMAVWRYGVNGLSTLYSGWYEA